MTDIFTPVTVGSYNLPNRIVMAPMTRSRANTDGTVGALAAEYYGQRAGVGLIVTEGTQPSADGQGYMATPGIYTKEHIESWKKVIDAIHSKGSRVFMQIMHAGRMAHPDNTPHHRQAVAPSAIAAEGQTFTPSGMQELQTPRALTTTEVKQTIADFVHAAKSAVAAGADGVEIHGANAYLVHEFLAASANVREDEYGGSIENRARFAIEVAQAISAEIGADKTAIRLSPSLKLWGIDEGKEGPDVYRYLVKELDKLNLAYVHIMHAGNDALLQDIRKLWSNPLIVNRPNQDVKNIGKDIESGLADLEAYGRFILANPDFIERLKQNAPMNEADPASFYGGTEKGYTDYPSL